MDTLKSHEIKSMKSRNFLMLLIYATALGILVGLAISMFLQVLHWLIEFIWKEIPHRISPTTEELPLYTLIVCSIGGLLVGFSQKYLGDYPKPMHEALEDVRTEGGFDYQHIPQGVIFSLISLGFGASLGPEAALIGLTGGLATSLFVPVSVGAVIGCVVRLPGLNQQ